MAFSMRFLAAAFSASLLSGCGSYYDGPPSDHFDGTRFFLPGLESERGRLDFLKWQFTRERAEWPESVANPPAEPPLERVPGSDLRVTFVGHASFLIQTQGLNILTDPVWSERASPFTWNGPKRVRAPGIALEALPPIDQIWISHNHYDHLDVATLQRLWTDHRPRILVPLGNDRILQDAIAGIEVEAYDWGDRVDLGDGLAIHLDPMQHWSARGLFDRNKALWAAFTMETPDGALVFIGDSGYGDGATFRAIAERHGPVRLAILPIGAYEPRWFMRQAHMNPEEAVAALRDLDAQRGLASHFETFQMTDEAFHAPRADLEVALAKAGLSPETFPALQPGQVLDLPARAPLQASGAQTTE